MAFKEEACSTCDANIFSAAEGLRTLCPATAVALSAWCNELRRSGSFQGVTYNTFADAAISTYLLLNDLKFEHCIRESALMQMPAQLRLTLEHICIFCSPAIAAEMLREFAADFRGTSRHQTTSHRARLCENVRINSTQSLLNRSPPLTLHHCSCKAVVLLTVATSFPFQRWTIRSHT